jgi:hypothetical protein
MITEQSGPLPMYKTLPMYNICMFHQSACAAVISSNPGGGFQDFEPNLFVPGFWM